MTRYSPYRVNPSWANAILALYFATLPILAVGFSVAGFGITISMLLLGVLIVLQATRAAENQTSFRIPLEGASLAFLITVLAAVLSLIMVVLNPPVPRAGEWPLIKGAKQVIGLGMMYVAYLVVYNQATGGGTRAVVWAARLYLLAGLLFSAYGMYQLFSIALNLGLPLTDLPVTNASLGEFRNVGMRGGFYRVASVMVEPAYFGFHVLTFAALSGALFATRDDRVLRSRPFVGALIVLFVIVLVLSFSRAAYVGLLAAALTVAYALGRTIGARTLVRLLSALAFATGLLFLWQLTSNTPIFQSIGAQLATLASPTEDLSVLERATGLATAFRMFWDNPLLGVGFGTYGFRFEDYAPTWGFSVAAAQPGSLPVVHSLPARFLAETGLVGTLAFLVFIVAVFRAGLIACSEAEETTVKALSAGFLGAFVGYVVTLGGTAAVYEIPLLWPLAAIIVSLKRLAVRSSTHVQNAKPT